MRTILTLSWSAMLFLLFLPACVSIQSSALKNESTFAGVPVLVSKKINLGAKDVAVREERTFSYMDNYDYTGGNNGGYAVSAEAIGLIELDHGTWISVGSQKGLKDGEAVQLSADCSYSFFFAIPLMVIHKHQFQCDARTFFVQQRGR